MKALIIGGGIGGVSAAIALQRVGIEAVVFEQADTLREIGAGLSVWTNAVKALRKLGAGDSVLASGSIIERFEARNWQENQAGKTPVTDEVRGAVKQPPDFDERTVLTEELHKKHGVQG